MSNPASELAKMSHPRPKAFYERIQKMAVAARKKKAKERREQKENSLKNEQNTSNT